MPVDYFTPLTRADIDAMNTGARALGPAGSNVVTAGECADLAEFLDVDESSARRWFGVVDQFGRTPAYRRLVPMYAPPGRPHAYTALGRAIADMRPETGMDAAAVQAVNQLMFRCYLGAAAGAGGLTRDAIYSEEIRAAVDFHPTLSVCLEVIEDLLTGNFGEHGSFMMMAWYSVVITHRPILDLPWQLTIRARRPNYTNEDSKKVPPVTWRGFPNLFSD